VVVAISKVGASTILNNLAVTINDESKGKKFNPLKFLMSFFFKGDFDASLKIAFSFCWKAVSPMIGLLSR
jgi:hypothetical protein